MSNIVGSTLLFPIQPDIRGSLKTIPTQSDIIVQAIQDVIETRKTERVMMPDLGLDDYIFSVQDFGFAARIAYALEDQILKYVPLVKSVAIQSAADEEGRATIELQYTEVGQIDAPKNLVYPVWQLQQGVTV